MWLPLYPASLDRATSSFFPSARFWLWAKLTSGSLQHHIVSLKIKVVIEPCDVSMVPSTFLLHISICLIMSLFKYIFMTPLDEIVLWSSSTFWLLPRCELNSWLESYHPCLSMNLCCHQQHPCPFSWPQDLVMFCVYLKFLANLGIDPCVFLLIFKSNFT